MTVEEFKKEVTKQINGFLPTHFNFKTGGVLSEENDRISMEAEITFEYGNCKHTHAINAGWCEVDGIGLEIGGASDLYPLNRATVFEHLYFSLALIDLEDQYIP